MTIFYIIKMNLSWVIYNMKKEYSVDHDKEVLEMAGKNRNKNENDYS